MYELVLEVFHQTSEEGEHVLSRVGEITKVTKQQQGIAEGKESPEPSAQGGEERPGRRGEKGEGGHDMKSLGLGLYPQA